METENTTTETAPVEKTAPELKRAEFTDEEKTALGRYVELIEMAKAERDK